MALHWQTNVGLCKTGSGLGPKDVYQWFAESLSEAPALLWPRPQPSVIKFPATSRLPRGVLFKEQLRITFNMQGQHSFSGLNGSSILTEPLNKNN